jgi:TIGR03009 family protein
MRSYLCSIVALLAMALTASAQQQENLDTVLLGWEKAMTDLRSFAAVVERETLDKALQSKDQWKGYAMFMKAAKKDDGSKARLELYKISSPEIFEKYICDGKELYEYAPTNKLVRVHKMPQNGRGVQQESFLSFLFGMSAAQAQGRYDMEVVFPSPGKIDPHYHYVRVKPRTPQDKSDFKEAQLSLYRANHLPARIWYLQPNGNEITWDFSKLQIDVQIPESYFQPALPKDWRAERVPAKN